MNLAIPVLTFLGVAGFMQNRRKRCTGCRRNVRVAGMVGACCKGCADGHKCDSEEDEEEAVDEEEAAEYQGTGDEAVGEYRSRYKSKRRRF